MFEKRVRMTAAAFGQFPFPPARTLDDGDDDDDDDVPGRPTAVAAGEPRPNVRRGRAGGFGLLRRRWCRCRLLPSVTAAAAAPVGGEPEPRDGLRATQFNVIARRGQSRTVASDRVPPSPKSQVPYSHARIHARLGCLGVHGSTPRNPNDKARFPRSHRQQETNKGAAATAPSYDANPAAPSPFEGTNARVPRVSALRQQHMPRWKLRVAAFSEFELPSRRHGAATGYVVDDPKKKLSGGLWRMDAPPRRRLPLALALGFLRKGPFRLGLRTTMEVGRAYTRHGLEAPARVCASFAIKFTLGCRPFVPEVLSQDPLSPTQALSYPHPSTGSRLTTTPPQAPQQPLSPLGFRLREGGVLADTRVPALNACTSYTNGVVDVVVVAVVLHGR
ncbi:hypothetical protein Purlil1_4662 [Purpureocillium lilacinum]|uniref:Uncharacterized protein n=1 Tax=Purpureocillium lilacinum TaxID=33203 RepID=A0ABR0C423_PURLI|nr:hypothetical protein Purlil1_4662 [Purpureocillium lilacinum]